MRRRQSASRRRHGAAAQGASTRVATVFAGADIEATERARRYFAGFEPSSPSIGLLRDGELVWMLERRQIENRGPEQIAAMLTSAFNQVLCAGACQSLTVVVQRQNPEQRTRCRRPRPGDRRKNRHQGQPEEDCRQLVTTRRIGRFPHAHAANVGKGQTNHHAKQVFHGPESEHALLIAPPKSWNTLSVIGLRMKYSAMPSRN